MTQLADNGMSVEVTVRGPDGDETRLEARYLIGCDGGRSLTRKLLDIPFEGQTDSTRWLVVDIAKDPIGIPNAILFCDPAWPYVTIALPHGVRRLEFMLKPHETEEELTTREALDRLLAPSSPTRRRPTSSAAGSVVVLRPDSIVAGVCRPQEISSAIVELGKVMRLTPESPLAARLDCSTPS